MSGLHGHLTLTGEEFDVWPCLNKRVAAAKVHKDPGNLSDSDKGTFLAQQHPQVRFEESTKSVDVGLFFAPFCFSDSPIECVVQAVGIPQGLHASCVRCLICAISN